MRKNSYKYLLTAAFAAAALSVQAQRNETGESPRKLYKENRMPGLQYASATTATKNGGATKPFLGSSLRHQLEEGRAGVPVKKGGAAAKATTQKPAGEQVALPSDQPATEKKIQIPQLSIPTQEEQTSSSDETKEVKPAAAPAASK